MSLLKISLNGAKFKNPANSSVRCDVNKHLGIVLTQLNYIFLNRNVNKIIACSSCSVASIT